MIGEKHRTSSMLRYPFHAACLILCLLGSTVTLAEPPASGFSIDAGDRFLARWFYNIVYPHSMAKSMLASSIDDE